MNHMFGGQPSPSPDFPQPIHVVTGNNTIGVQGKNLANLSILNDVPSISNGNLVYYKGGACTDFIEIDNTKNYYFSFSQYQGTTKYVLFYDANKTYLGYSTIDNTYNLRNYANYSQSKYVRLRVDVLSRIEYVQLEQGSTATSYVPYYHTNYPINLGSIELCKIGDYQDYLYKENGNWYKKPNILKTNFSANTVISKVEKSSNDLAFNFIFYDYCDLNYNNTLVKCSHYPTYSRIIYNKNSIFNNYQTDTIIIHAFDDIFTSEMTVEQAKAKFYELYDDKLVFYTKLEQEPIEITDETLIAQLEAIYNHLALVKGTNHITITPSDLEPYVTLNYMQDLPSKLDNLDSRLALLE